MADGCTLSGSRVPCGFRWSKTWKPTVREPTISLINKIRQYMPAGITIVEQGRIVADSLADYLHRHPEMEQRLGRGGTVRYLTTENADRFGSMATVFLDSPITATHIDL